MKPVVLRGDTVSPESKRSHRRVLLVDDNDDFVDLMRDLLELKGHTVEIATSGAATLEVAARLSPHIAFLDIGLPGMNGLDLVRHLRRLATCSGIPIFAVTGNANPRDRAASLEAGFTDHLVKPLTGDTMLRLVEDAAIGEEPPEQSRVRVRSFGGAAPR